MNPLVSCIMPTHDRRAFVQLALRWFAAQDYPERELIVVDDGSTPVEDLLPDDPRIRYLSLTQRTPVGIKRNIACEAARGELVAHWDDDDWFAPTRLSAQVEVMGDTSIDLCGIDTLLYYDLRDGRAWRYVHPRRARPWLSLLMYRRTLWTRIGHSAARVGSDTRFVWRVDPKRMLALPHRDMNVCLLHANNLAPKNTRGVRWHSTPVDEVIATLGDDWRFYCDGLEAPAPPAVNRRPHWRVFIPVVAQGHGLEPLLADLDRAAAGASVEVHVATDVDRRLSSRARAIVERHGWRHEATLQAGRPGYVALLDDAFAAARTLAEGALFLCLPEDATLGPDFFPEAAAIWTSAREQGALALTLRGQAGGLKRPLWTGFKPVRAGVLWHTGRIEEAFIAGPAFFQALGFETPPVPGRWLADPTLSSGVERGVSIRLHQAGHRLLRSTHDLIGRQATPNLDISPVAPWTVVITTYQRPQLLARLLDDLEQARAGGLNLEVRVYDDASTVDYRRIRARLDAANWHYTRALRNHGKQRLWQWMSRAFSDLRDITADRMIAFLQDDVRLCVHFFTRAEALWRGINDPQKVTLNVFADHTRAASPVWTNVPPRRQGDVWKTQWVDGLYVTTRRYLELLDFAVPPVSPRRWDRDPSLSSGVGQNISIKLDRAGYGMYRVDRSLVAHVEARSELNPIARSLNPLGAARFIDGDAMERKLRRVVPVFAALATIPSRLRQLEATIASLLPQVHRVYVYLNGHEQVPACLDHPRIEVASSQDHGDRGDAGKFFWAGRLDGCVLTCDDDIIYPPDYATRMVLALERYHRRAVVGLHGITLRTPVRSYYRDREVVHCERALAAPRPVHLVGTGCAAYHTSALDLDPAHFETPNMADIWFGLACQRQGTPVVAVARPDRWVVLQPVKSSIFSRFGSHDHQQTAMVRTIPRWQLRSPGEQ